MYPDQQRFWTALLNLQRTWASDDAAMAFIPPRFRDFESKPDWPRPKAQAYLLNNLELIRENYRRLEAGEPLEYELLNHGLADLTLRLQPWTNPTDLKRAATAKTELGGRLEVLQVTPEMESANPGTRYIRATIQRSFYYFAQYVDSRLSDPHYPEVSPGRPHVRVDPAGDLVLVTATASEPTGG
ncbi:MAG: hypothetical protein QNJ90_02990 [Planctomycetota bacterium]|nr:hypothetical protein [Planctomycetota bacterium]